MRQVILDTETTGLSAHEGDRILEIGCVELINRQPTGNNKHYYINPQRDSHEEALRVHGLTSEFLANKPLFKDIAHDLVEFIKGSELVIHNAPFDVGFLNKEFELLGLPILEELDTPITDSLQLAREKFPGKRNSLDALCERFEIDNSDRVLHGALLDAQLLAEVYICLTRGQHNLLGDGNNDAYNSSKGSYVVGTDLTHLQLPVIKPTPEELQQHDVVLEKITKESGGKTVWQPKA